MKQKRDNKENQEVTFFQRLKGGILGFKWQLIFLKSI